VLNIITKYESGEPFVDSKKGGRKKISTDSFELYLHFYAKNELEFNKGRTTLYNIIKTMGYKYKKGNNRLVLSEKPHIKALKLKFLKTYLQYLENLKI
jgi:hypothetical protein